MAVGKGNADEFGLERKMRDLLLDTFADGERVEGEWVVASVPDAIPDWQVTIERVGDDEPEHSD